MSSWLPKETGGGWGAGRGELGWFSAGTRGPRGFLTLTSQMLIPPSMPVVQNWEHLSFPPVSTEIWLWVHRGSSNQPQG